jgi:hypothetical protein
MNWQKTLFSDSAKLRWLQPHEYAEMRVILNRCVEAYGLDELAKELECAPKMIADWLKRETRPGRKNYIKLKLLYGKVQQNDEKTDLQKPD